MRDIDRCAHMYTLAFVHFIYIIKHRYAYLYYWHIYVCIIRHRYAHIYTMGVCV